MKVQLLIFFGRHITFTKLQGAKWGCVLAVGTRRIIAVSCRIPKSQIQKAISGQFPAISDSYLVIRGCVSISDTYWIKVRGTFWEYPCALVTKLQLEHDGGEVLVKVLYPCSGWEWTLISDLFPLVVGLFFPCEDKGIRKTLQELGGRALGPFLVHSNRCIHRSHTHDPIPRVFQFHYL